MSDGTLYVNSRIRSCVPRSLVGYLGLKIEVIDPAADAKKFGSDFPLKKVPSFTDNHGFKLTEHIAINRYFVDLSGDEKLKHQLLGRPGDFKAQADILRWESLINSDFLISLYNVYGALEGEIPYVKRDVEKALSYANQIAELLEERLYEHTYLVTEDITMADLVATAILSRGFKSAFGEEWRAEHPATMRWFNTVRASGFLKEEFKDFKFIEKPLQPPASKKKQQQQQPAKKAEQPKKAAKAETGEEEAPAPKKPKHPLESLGKSTFVLDEWKRKYSNEDTRPVALPWFWEHFNAEEYSIWRVDYKYNDELTLTFMSNNLVGGFFNRLSASTKYVFGSLVVYGENNNNGIIGAIMVRGQDYVPAFDVAPDWESYSYVKLDPTNEEDREFVNNMWAWDKPVTVNNEAREIADGKVLK